MNEIESTFRLESSLDGNYLCADMGMEEMDEIAVRMMRNDCPTFLVPFHLSEANGRANLRYKLESRANLKDSARTMRRVDFVKLMDSLTSPFAECTDWLLDYHCICINPEYVFLTDSGRATRYIYIPVASPAQSDADIWQFFKELMPGYEISDSPALQIKLMQYVSRDDATLAGLREMVAVKGQAAQDAGAVSPDSGSNANTLPPQGTMTAPNPIPPVRQPGLKSGPGSSANTVSPSKPVPDRKPVSAIGTLFGDNAASNGKQDRKKAGKEKRAGFFGRGR